MSRARPGHEHFRERLRHLRFVATVALEHLGVELALAVSGHIQVLDAARGRHQSAWVIAIAIAFALGTALSPPHPDERV
jgi:hypothetical protein